MFAMLLPSLAAFVVAAAPGASAPAYPTYAVASVSKRAVSKLDLGVDRRARKFKSQLGKAVGQRANFAGHYIVVTWGCGTSCQAVATVDVETGVARVAPFSTSLGSEFRADSRLFVDSPQEAVREMGSNLFTTRYFVWNEDKKAFEPVPSTK
jgi:hypothetical protein